jgi:S1-C subfamily serine protease
MSLFNPDELRGLLITGVIPNSTSAQAGLDAGDIITRVNNERVVDIAEFVEKCGAAGGLARLTIFDRRAECFRPADVRPDGRGMIGVYVVPTGQFAGYPRTVLLVNGVNPGSAAHQAGLMPGDVILQINGGQVPTADDFVRQFQMSGPIASMTYIRGMDGTTRVINVPADPMGRIGAFIVPVPWC